MWAEKNNMNWLSFNNFEFEFHNIYHTFTKYAQSGKHLLDVFKMSTQKQINRGNSVSPKERFSVEENIHKLVE